MTNVLYVQTLEKRVSQLFLELEAKGKRADQLQEEVEDLAHSLFQVLQGERNAIQGFKAGLTAAGKFNAEVWGFLYRNCDPMDMTPEDTEWYDSLRRRYGES